MCLTLWHMGQCVCMGANHVQHQPCQQQGAGGPGLLELSRDGAVLQVCLGEGCGQTGCYRPGLYLALASRLQIRRSIPWALAHLLNSEWEKGPLGQPLRLSGIPGSFLLGSRVRSCKVWLVNVVTNQPQDATECPPQPPVLKAPAPWLKSQCHLENLVDSKLSHSENQDPPAECPSWWHTPPAMEGRDGHNGAVCPAQTSSLGEPTPR